MKTEMTADEERENDEIFGKLDLHRFTPVAKNPTISKLMLQMGHVEEVGSGVRNVDKYLKHYSKGATYEFIDAEIFSMTINLRGTIEESSQKGGQKSDQKILNSIKLKPQTTINELMNQTGLTRRGVEWNLEKLKKAKVIKREGSKKTGKWLILKND